MNKPENTCLGKACPLSKKFKDCCPNYMESWWTPSPDTAGKKGQPFMIEDCAPKRTFLMIQELSNRLVGVQEAQESMRNEVNRLLEVMNALVLETARRVALKNTDERDIIDV